MSAVFASFFLVVVSILTYFIPSASSYGWPETNFFLELPETAKAVIVAVTAIIFNIPVFVSCIFYFLLLKYVKRSPKIENIDLDNVSSVQQNENDAVGGSPQIANVLVMDNVVRDQGLKL